MSVGHLAVRTSGHTLQCGSSVTRDGFPDTPRGTTKLQFEGSMPSSRKRSREQLRGDELCGNDCWLSTSSLKYVAEIMCAGGRSWGLIAKLRVGALARVS